MASDRKIIEDQLRHAQKTGNKKRAKKLKARLKQVQDYEAGKNGKGKVRQQVDAAQKDFDKYGHHYPGKGRLAKAYSYMDAHDRAKSYEGGSIVKGDKKRARKQTRARKLRNVNNAIENRHLQAGTRLAGLVGILGGAVYSGQHTKKETQRSKKQQHGAESRNTRKKIRRGNKLVAAGAGAWYGGLVGGGKTKVTVAGAAIGYGVGHKLAHMHAPDNTKTSKKHVYFTRDEFGRTQRSSVKNPYYTQKRNGKTVRVKKGKRK